MTTVPNLDDVVQAAITKAVVSAVARAKLAAHNSMPPYATYNCWERTE